MNFTAFLSYVLLTTFTPGPNNIMCMSNASKDGFKKTFPFVLGAVSGYFVILCLGAAFTTLLYNIIPAVEPYMLVVGAAYILWLAWTVWRSKPHEEKKGLAAVNSYGSGFLLQFVNIKGILFAVTVMSSFILPFYQSIPVVSVFALALTAIGLASTTSWALFGAVFERFFKKYSKITNGVMALLLVYCAVTMILDIFKPAA